MRKQEQRETRPEFRQPVVRLLPPFSRNYGVPGRDPIYGWRRLYNIGVRGTEETTKQGPRLERRLAAYWLDGVSTFSDLGETLHVMFSKIRHPRLIQMASDGRYLQRRLGPPAVVLVVSLSGPPAMTVGYVGRKEKRGAVFPRVSGMIDMPGFKIVLYGVPRTGGK